MNLKRRFELAFFRMQGYFPGNIGGKSYRFVPEDRKFWRKVAKNLWEPHTFKILDRCLSPHSVYVDIGAWIGPTVLYAAERCFSVYCVEPDSVAYERLLANLRMNRIRNVHPFHGAIGEKTGKLQISNVEDLGNSETRVSEDMIGDAGVVLSKSLSDYLSWWKIAEVDLIKIDIEGAEFDLLTSLMALPESLRKKVYLSLHAPHFPERDRREKLVSVAEFARDYRYCYDKNLGFIDAEEIPKGRFLRKYSEILLSNTPL